MRSKSILCSYNRYIVQYNTRPGINFVTGKKEDREPLSAFGLLGFFAAGESKLISSFVKWSEGDATTYQ